MRGSEKLKGILEINKGAQSILIKSIILYNFIVLFVYFHRKTSLTLFLILSVSEILSTFFIFKICKPKIVKENGIEKLVDVISINSPGKVSFCWDVLFWSMIGKALVAFNWKWGLVYLGIPISFFFEFIYKPFRRLTSNK